MDDDTTTRLRRADDNHVDAERARMGGFGLFCEGSVMTWSKPNYAVVSLGAEINSYVSAQLPK